MVWACEFCTFENKIDSAKKCDVCEMGRGANAVDQTRESSGPQQPHVQTKPAKVSSKSTVQATLFGGIAQEQPKKKAAPKKSKLAAAQQADTKPTTLQNSTATAKRGNDNSEVATAAASVPVPVWKTTARRDMPLEELKQRAKLAMKHIFRVEKLRLLQPKAVSTALKRRSQIVVMATGGGKSLCYQLPAVVLGGTTIVVSPLIALMQDQAQALVQKGVSAAVISSANGERENKGIMERLLGRRLSKPTKSKLEKPLEHITVLYVTPEQVQTNGFREALKELYRANKLSLFAIDEAHCLSSWGHDFRKAYLRLDYLRDTYPDVPLIACTATATTQVIDDIKTTLRLHDSKCHIGSFDRPNIFYEVRYKDSLEALAVGGATKDLVAFINKQHQRFDKRDLACSGIVYCHTRADTTGLAAAIQKETGIRAVSYHGGMKADERTRVQQSWTCGAAPIAVATVAFGMGIDLAQVRYVVHWNFSKTPEAFYQESGRAGRDGLPAFSLLYYSKDDEAKFRYFLSQKKSKNDSKADDSTSAKRDQNALQEMVNYCMVPGCRRSCLLKHFGEEMTDPTEICVDKCDYCLEPDKVRQAIEAAGAVGNFVCYKRGPPQAQLARNPVDDDEDDEEDHFGAPLKVGDLRVSGSGAYMELVDTDYSAKPSVNFERASSVLKKYEAIERKGSDFVNFKAKSDSMDAVKSNDRIRIPQHLIPPKTANANRAMSNGTASTKEKSSSDFAAEADQLRDAIAKANARQLELVNRTKARRMPPPPPPSVAFTTKRKR